ncbi:CDP-diacylglycerol--serine O-phosphatidyltransferase [Arcticibacter tournemirensis]|uniref:CDP-diacylglycerol--serine O-phosphatidyltransferase n=1 Tax=Arcticibacter tournemirensis TaxID=699437 RepID=A0A5M9HLN4_9SPHI|nr:CDP-alcohol phosphatidyltransferase family protein [Arcticibacter tournemirensis]KAA8486314.1 CDP-diacylglycerol--serine O-phosphatidyltransferase [Arcticibacter tournemirensis]TQM52126.1 CDP-diacylglycerol--serine O-phosphatidyltransferase [Arcticibacter tournemirensis]
MKKHIPNAITCFNLFSGCVGIAFAFNNNLIYAGYAIIIAALFDFADGLIARALSVYSILGRELDSLADVISFGLLPSVIVYQLFLAAPQLGELSIYLNYSAFMITIFSALRLAKFNIDARQTDHFIGLPTPANALLVASLPMIISEAGSFWSSYILNPYFLFIFSIGMGFLLVMEVPLISLKFKSFALNENLLRYILLFSAALLIVLFKFVAVPFIIFIYIVLSVIQFKF